MTTVLDHGYVTLIESWGSDARVIESARMSTQKGFEGWGPRCFNCGISAEDGEGDRCCTHLTKNQKEQPHNFKPGDEKLLRYLWEHKHHTPFEMAGAIFEVQAPIFVFREWHRHRVPFSYNEASARYAPLPDLNYVPSVMRLMQGNWKCLICGSISSHSIHNEGECHRASDGKHDWSQSNKQSGRIEGAPILDEAGAELFRDTLRMQYEEAEDTYQDALGQGVPKELARLVLPVGRYSKMRVSSNLRGWMNFLGLRMHYAAQYEIQVYARAVHAELVKLFPRTVALFDEERLR